MSGTENLEQVKMVDLLAFLSEALSTKASTPLRDGDLFPIYIVMANHQGQPVSLINYDTFFVPSPLVLSTHLGACTTADAWNAPSYTWTDSAKGIDVPQ